MNGTYLEKNGKTPAKLVFCQGIQISRIDLKRRNFDNCKNAKTPWTEKEGDTSPQNGQEAAIVLLDRMWQERRRFEEAEVPQ